MLDTPCGKLRLLKKTKKLEEVMSTQAFAHAVLVKDENHIIREINTVDAATDFLDHWPQDRRGPIYGAAYQL